MMMDSVLVKISTRRFQQLIEIHELMEKEGMCDQDANFIIGRLIDIYLEKKRLME